MVAFRAILIVLLVVAGVCFAFYAGTGQARYKKLGLAILKWTLIAAFGFFLVLFVERLSS